MTADKDKHQRYIALFCALGVMLALVVYSKREVFTNPIYFHHDLAIQNYWRIQLTEPEAFPNDLLASYSSRTYSAAMWLTFRLLTSFVDHLTISRWLWIVYLPGTAYFLFRIGLLLGGPWIGFVVSSLGLLTAWNKVGADDPGSGGDFITMMIAGFVWALAEKRYWPATAMMVAGSLLHPVISVIHLVVLGIVILGRNGPLGLREGGWRPLSTLLPAGLFCIVLNLIWTFGRSSVDFGRMVTKAQIYSMPEFGSNGRVPMAVDGFWAWLTNGSVGLMPHGPGLAVLLALAIVLIIRNGKRGFHNFPGALWALGLAAVGMFILATLTLPMFFKPTRYFFQPFVIFLAALVGHNLALRLAIYKKSWQKLAFVLLPVLLLAGASAPYLRVLHTQAPDRQLYEYLAQLPNDSLIAAHPALALAIPTFAHKSVLVSSKLSFPYQEDYYAEIKRRTEDTFEALYASDVQTVNDFCHKYKITHLVVSEFHYRNAYFLYPRLYYEPFDRQVRNLAADASDSYLLNLPDEAKIFCYEHYLTEPLDLVTFHWNAIGDEQEAWNLPPAERVGPVEMFVTTCEYIEKAALAETKTDNEAKRSADSVEKSSLTPDGIN